MADTPTEAIAIMADLECALVMTREHNPTATVGSFVDSSIQFKRLADFLHSRQHFSAPQEPDERLAEQKEREAREVEGDSDNPLRVAAANRLYDDAAALRTPAQEPDDDALADAVEQAILLRLRDEDGKPYTAGFNNGVRAANVVARQALDRLQAKAPETNWPADAIFQQGAQVKKKGRASWRGTVVGWYRTELTALGLAIESTFEPGSVQIYPLSALEPWNVE